MSLRSQWRGGFEDEIARGREELGKEEMKKDTQQKVLQNIGLAWPVRADSGVAPANQTNERVKTRSSWISHKFLWILVAFLGKTSAIHIELWLQFALRKSSWTGLSLVWFAGVTPDRRAQNFVVKSGGFCRRFCWRVSWAFPRKLGKTSKQQNPQKHRQLKNTIHDSSVLPKKAL